MLQNGYFILVLILFFFACKQDTKVLSEAEMQDLIQTGDSIATLAQATLLKNVSNAIQTGGTAYAVDYCHTKAMPLTDSIANHLMVYIQRLSDKNRNPENAIQTRVDSMAWEKIKSSKTHFVEQDEKGDSYYYKPIAIAMPTCIKCHGGESDIEVNTRHLIQQKYPHDKAIDYKMGDLRGMWKIKL